VAEQAECCRIPDFILGAFQQSTVSLTDEPIQCRERPGGMLNFYIVKQLESTRSVICTIRAARFKGNCILNNHRNSIIADDGSRNSRLIVLIRISILDA
jgi:hypothetical protein